MAKYAEMEAEVVATLFAETSDKTSNEPKTSDNPEPMED